MNKALLVALALLCAATPGRAQSSSGNVMPVTADNFNRAETDLYFGRVIRMVPSENLFTTASQHPSTTKPLSASIVIRSTPRRCSISMPGR